MAPEPWYYGDKPIKWRNGYKKHRAQKVKIKEELLRVGCLRWFLQVNSLKQKHLESTAVT